MKTFSSVRMVIEITKEIGLEIKKVRSRTYWHEVLSEGERSIWISVEVKERKLLKYYKKYAF